MLVMKPILTTIALYHKLINKRWIMRLLAVAVTVKEIMTIVVFLISVVFFVGIELAREWHFPIATVTSKVYP